jgi:hypothetical protein
MEYRADERHPPSLKDTLLFHKEGNTRGTTRFWLPLLHCREDDPCALCLLFLTVPFVVVDVSRVYIS